MTTLLAIFSTVACVVILLFTRNSIVHRVRLRRINEINLLNMVNWPHTKYDYLMNLQPRDEMIYDLTRWTYRQFYPNPPRPSN